jgi:hypothetical protein
MTATPPRLLPAWHALLAAALLLGGAARTRAQDLDLGAELDAEMGEESDVSGSAETESDASSESESESDSESESEPEPESESESEPEAEPDADANAARVQAFLGGGIGTRSFLRPTLLGAQRLNDALFPAVDVGLTLLLWPADSFSFGLRAAYQSSLGLDIVEDPVFALPNEFSARAERVEFSLAPIFRLGDAQDSIALGFPIGFGMRTFWPEVTEFRTPGYSLAGPQLRVELIVPFSDTLRLRIGPELLWAVALDQTLQDQGVESQAIAVGGEAALSLQLGAVIGFELSYRESHAFASTTRTSATFEDVERFATLRLLGSL